MYDERIVVDNFQSCEETESNRRFKFLGLEKSGLSELFRASDASCTKSMKMGN